MNHRNPVLLAAAALAAAIGLGSAAVIALGPPAAIGRAPDATAQTDPRREPPLVQIAIAKPVGASERAFTGVVSARVQSNLGFRVPGKVIERLVDTGQVIEAGTLLYRIDSTDYEHAIAVQLGNVATAEARLIQATADEKRYRRLLPSGAVSASEYDAAKAAADSARALLDAAQAQLKIAQDEGRYTTLLADADGTVVDTLAEPGQVVAAAQTVVKLAHAGPREATVNLPETVRPLIGSPARARLYGASSTPSPARLRQLSDAADPATRTYEARYVLGGEAARAPLGATVTVWVATAAGEAAEVPLGALYDDGKSTGLWVLDPETSSVSFHPAQVHRLAAETAIVGGVPSGVRVVALGAHLLHEGERVRVAEQTVAAQ
jgi:RND family efflux transporter MFP subunit